MKLEFNGIVYVIKWEYKHGIASSDFKARTWCRVFVDNEQVACGVANCSWQDQFSKKTGRKLAFKRAIDTLFNCEKEFRTSAWHEYFKMSNRVDLIRQINRVKPLS